MYSPVSAGFWTGLLTQLIILRTVCFTRSPHLDMKTENTFWKMTQHFWDPALSDRPIREGQRVEHLPWMTRGLVGPL